MRRQCLCRFGALTIAVCLAVMNPFVSGAEEYYEDYDTDSEDTGDYEDDSYEDGYYEDEDYEADSYDDSEGGSDEASDQTGSDGNQSAAGQNSTAMPTSPAVTTQAGARAVTSQEHQEVSTGDWENYTTNYSDWPQGPGISAASALVMEDSTGTILYASNMDSPMDPGSTVKILTVMLALEKAGLKDEVTMTETGVQGVTEGGLNISAQIGEVFTVEQCAYAVILASANDVALQLAEHVGGSIDAFVQLMNARAAEIGCTGSHFTNPTGLEDPNQYSTAHDLALIMHTALHNEDFRRIISATTYTIPATNMSGGARTMASTFSMVNGASSDYYSGTLGGKQGYTGTAGTTILCAAERKGMTLICALLQGSEGTASSEVASLLDFCYNTFSILSLGDDDFDVVSGGEVVAPAGITVEDMTYADHEEDSKIIRTYYYDSLPIGTAVVNPQQNAIDEAALNADRENLEEARVYSQGKSPLPYIIIALLGIALMVVWFFQARKLFRR